eukprot:CAMPEP_0172785960 /NCGR_PEP_ID=MMETSP1074-20121228/205707_1 /TAXON_ID=2916 /ORGANISM="Ceratium fusus, Strain PA161109" /LENGTH=319 /DNA_ID=CAMNT_0013622973 /DNA_START=68 /DNA_END=1027 /DNA_ORIENTATION=+
MSEGRSVPPLFETEDALDFVVKLARPLSVALLLNGSFFVGELAMLMACPLPQVRKVIDGFAHILTAPISVIAFYGTDSLGTLLFFGSLWHFLCDCAQTRPTYVLLLPCRGWRTSSRDCVRWFESLWILLHHIFIGTVKLGLDWGIFNESRDPLLLFIFVGGAGLAHLSFGMNAFGIRGSLAMLVISQLLRLGADVAIVLKTWGQDDDWKFFMLADPFWLCTLLMTRIAGSYCSCCTRQRAQVSDDERQGANDSSTSIDPVVASSVIGFNSAEADLALVCACSSAPDVSQLIQERELKLAVGHAGHSRGRRPSWPTTARV